MHMRIAGKHFEWEKGFGFLWLKGSYFRLGRRGILITEHERDHKSTAPRVYPPDKKYPDCWHIYYFGLEILIEEYSQECLDKHGEGVAASW